MFGSSLIHRVLAFKGYSVFVLATEAGFVCSRSGEYSHNFFWWVFLHRVLVIWSFWYLIRLRCALFSDFSHKIEQVQKNLGYF